LHDGLHRSASPTIHLLERRWAKSFGLPQSLNSTGPVSFGKPARYTAYFRRLRLIPSASSGIPTAVSADRASGFDLDHRQRWKATGLSGRAQAKRRQDTCKRCSNNCRCFPAPPAPSWRSRTRLFAPSRGSTQRDPKHPLADQRHDLMFDQIPPPLVVESRFKSMHHFNRTTVAQQKPSGIRGERTAVDAGANPNKSLLHSVGIGALREAVRNHCCT